MRNSGVRFQAVLALALPADIAPIDQQRSSLVQQEVGAGLTFLSSPTECHRFQLKLIALCLEEWGLLTEPLLYISLFFKRHRQEYYYRLEAIRSRGDWEGWLSFFLEGVAIASDEAVSLIGSLFELLTDDRSRYLASGHATVAGARLFESLPQNPIVDVRGAIRLCGATRPTAAKAIESLNQVEARKLTLLR